MRLAPTSMIDLTMDEAPHPEWAVVPTSVCQKNPVPWPTLTTGCAANYGHQDRLRSYPKR